MVKEKRKNNTINQIIIILSIILGIILLFQGIIKETTIINKIIGILLNGLSITYFILELISTWTIKRKKKIVKNIARSFLISLVTINYSILSFYIMDNVIGYIISFILLILMILGIIFNSINKKIVWKVFLTIITLTNIIIVPIIFLITTLDPFYILLIGNILIDLSLIFFYLSKYRYFKTSFYLTFSIGILLSNYYLIKYGI